MAYDERLADRIRRVLARQKGLTEKKMFGGVAFMLHGKMCCGVVKDDFVVRVDPERYEEALAEPHTRQMDFMAARSEDLCLSVMADTGLRRLLRSG